MFNVYCLAKSIANFEAFFNLLCQKFYIWQFFKINEAI